MSSNKLTLIIGASDNPERYSHKAAVKLKSQNFPFKLMGVKNAAVLGEEILAPLTSVKNIDTITMYVNPEIQKEYYDYVIGLAPRRVIFNPGTENPEFMQLLQTNGIEVVENCTLVMLSLKMF